MSISGFPTDSILCKWVFLRIVGKADEDFTPQLEHCWFEALWTNWWLLLGFWDSLIEADGGGCSWGTKWDPQFPLYVHSLQLESLTFTWTWRFGICHRNCSYNWVKGGIFWRSELDLVSPARGILGEVVLLSGAGYWVFGSFLYTDNTEWDCVQASVVSEHILLGLFGDEFIRPLIPLRSQFSLYKSGNRLCRHSMQFLVYINVYKAGSRQQKWSLLFMKLKLVLFPEMNWILKLFQTTAKKPNKPPNWVQADNF